jgi:hypothetical protein
VTTDIESIYSVDLLCEAPVTVDHSSLLSSLRAKCPGVDPLSRQPKEGLYAFVQTEHPVEFKDGKMPAQLLIMPGDRGNDSVSIEEAVQQSWGQKDAGTLVASAPHKVFVSDMMASGLPYKERLGIFLDALEAILDVIPSRAIHWRPSQQIVLPGTFLDGRREEGSRFIFSGPLNVRFYNVSSGEVAGEKLVDTMGLAALGLPDIQCHFHDLDVDAVVSSLYNVGLYIFENGDVIDDGHTVPGLGADERWSCQHEDALAPPKRAVLDLNPGPRFAAGGRG